jgi:hypothetical protein
LLIVETRETPRFTSQQLYTKLLQMEKTMLETQSYGTTPTPRGSWDGTEPSIDTINSSEVATSIVCCPNLSTRATF